MDWFFKIMRIAGASFPVASSLVQLNSELESAELTERITKLSDPISYLHEDIQDVSKEIYTKVKTLNSNPIELSERFYERYRRPLAALESADYIKGLHVIGHKYKDGISLQDPSYIMYLCALAEEPEKMGQLHKVVDSCKVGQQINGKNLEVELDLPLVVIDAIFEIYSSKGYGLRSKEVGASIYIGSA